MSKLRILNVVRTRKWIYVYIDGELITKSKKSCSMQLVYREI